MVHHIGLTIPNGTDSITSTTDARVKNGRLLPDLSARTFIRVKCFQPHFTLSLDSDLNLLGLIPL